VSKYTPVRCDEVLAIIANIAIAVQAYATWHTRFFNLHDCHREMKTKLLLLPRKYPTYVLGKYEVRSCATTTVTVVGCCYYGAEISLW
jgi:hypothetical protein